MTLNTIKQTQPTKQSKQTQPTKQSKQTQPSKQSKRPFPILDTMPILIQKEFTDKCIALPQGEARELVETLFDHYIGILKMYNETYRGYSKACDSYYALYDDYDEDFDTVENFLKKIKTIQETLINSPVDRYLLTYLFVSLIRDL